MAGTSGRTEGDVIVTLRLEMDDGTTLEVPRTVDEIGDDPSLNSVVFEETALKLISDIQLLVETRYGVPPDAAATLVDGSF